ncbi:MAG: hypothetical protein V9F46_11725 [Chitinophagaceae bacterium]
MYSYIQNPAVSEKQGDNEMAELFYKKANTLADSLPTPLIRLVFNQSYIPYLINRPV